MKILLVTGSFPPLPCGVGDYAGRLAGALAEFDLDHWYERVIELEGSMRAAASIGKGAEAYSMHIKGLEMPAYEPRGAKSQGYNYVTASIGANHCYGYAGQDIFGAPFPRPTDRFSEENADIVIYLELLKYEMRNPDAPQLRRGTINSSVMVYDLAQEDGPEKFELEEVWVRVPEDGSVGVMNKSGTQMRKMAYEKFAELVARKFYEYEIEMET